MEKIMHFRGVIKIINLKSFIMTPEPPLTRWKTSARILADDYLPGRVSTNDVSDLKIAETARSVDMDEGDAGMEKDPYGIPVSAKLGIALIASFQKLISPLREKLKSNNFNEFFTEEQADTLTDLLTRSSAITIDKNVLLKTLSQPGCEGVRFYLCKKMVADAGKEKAYISLVTVGVDAKGQDLHYEYNEGRLQSGLLAAHLLNTSLVSEYGSPPPPRTAAFALEEFDNKFALLKYALDEAKNIE